MPTAQNGKSGTTRKTPTITIATRGKAPVAPAPAAKVSKPRKKSTPAMTEGVWREMVATAAYYRAQARGFQPGSHVQDWLAAEAELKKQLGKA